ncbi:hypothetical protein HGQ62_01630 [Stenotrophomonas maltophilia]|jgi:hypothetical protein|uniref:hypothetical protein n=1 Tax=Stenotrophomonas TaxID=40323 RepID=UPI000C14565A|nr:hypothetical protein [Stenotrophomonas maltophilia]NMT33347.1 hypothetical protein [Stenotrophomonas maltophilia]NMT71805.1 hypothetical protein [Stenotrophomonas maltophilia]QJC73981.1 hypothetical protein HGN30_08460 [Stenotrophomonas maltophilia]HEP1207032.1 hypothetical protein [Stenotrophomonas maltophilia]
MTFATRNVGAARVGIAVLVLFLVGMAMAALVSISIPEANKDSFGMLIGGLNNATGMVIGYFFGMTRRPGG